MMYNQVIMCHNDRDQLLDPCFNVIWTCTHDYRSDLINWSTRKQTRKIIRLLNHYNAEYPINNGAEFERLAYVK